VLQQGYLFNTHVRGESVNSRSRNLAYKTEDIALEPLSVDQECDGRTDRQNRY